MVRNPNVEVAATTKVSPSKGQSSSDSHSLAHQYGGNSITGWVSYLPITWVPYIQLARLNPPAGLFLIYFPHLFGILLAAIRLRRRTQTSTYLDDNPYLTSNLLHTSLIVFSASFFVSNAIHIWNDLVDAPLDALVSRTKNRPIPRGAVSRTQALIFTITQALCAAAFLPLLNDSIGAAEVAIWATPGAVAWAYYPFAKRHVDFPQVVLGFCLAWGVVMGCLGMGLRPVELTWEGNLPVLAGIDRSVVCLFLACILWSVIYDSIYAHQDVDDDIKYGIKSLAVRYREQMKQILWALLGLMMALLVTCGLIAGLGAGWNVVGVGGTGVTLATMVLRVRLSESASCWWWFGKGFWWVGFAVSGGLLAELMRH